LMFGIRISGITPHESARIVPFERGSPITGAVSRDDRKRWKIPFSINTSRRAGTPSSS